MRGIFIAAIALFLTGCNNVPGYHVIDTVEVKVPVLERAIAPDELRREKVSNDELPRWVAPNDSTASVCIGGMSEPKLKTLLLGREALLDGWESYAAP